MLTDDGGKRRKGSKKGHTLPPRYATLLQTKKKVFIGEHGALNKSRKGLGLPCKSQCYLLELERTRTLHIRGKKGATEVRGNTNVVSL